MAIVTVFHRSFCQRCADPFCVLPARLLIALLASLIGILSFDLWPLFSLYPCVCARMCVCVSLLAPPLRPSLSVLSTLPVAL